MGKDRTGKYHPSKGKPSGAAKEEGLGLHATEPEKMDQYLDITDRYTTGEDELAPGVPVRHPNRNTEKGYDRFKNQQDEQDNARKGEERHVAEERSKVTPEELPRMLTKEKFAELANFRSDASISVYLPTHTAGVEVNELADQIAFKHAIQEIAVMLKSKGRNQATIERLLEPAYTLVRDDAFWRNMQHGLAVFMADGYFKYMKLPFVPERELMVNNAFLVSPLIRLMTDRDYFYILTISKKQLKLFKADAFGIEFIPVKGLPDDILAVMSTDKTDETTFRMGGRGGTGGANFHGIGGGNNVDDKARIAAYFEMADDIIWKEVLHNETAPLMLAGVEYLIPIYKSVTDYKHVCEESLTGNHERDDTTSLYEQAMEKMGYFFLKRLNKAKELYGNQSATALTTSVTDDIIPATHYGQVSHLFVRKGAHILGRFDEMNNKLEMSDDGDDLVDLAVTKTLLSGGEVFLLEKEQMPAESALAAILRY
jgi:hypothetical protein